MSKEFTAYEESLKLEQLGFDEYCFAWHVSEKHGLEFGGVIKDDLLNDAVLAPTYSQAFRWFREKHDIGHSIDEDWDNGHLLGYEYVIYQQEGVTVSKTYHTYEEAELGCLKKLIGIVKSSRG